jgi:hypothetical protein
VGRPAEYGTLRKWQWNASRLAALRANLEEVATMMPGPLTRDTLIAAAEAVQALAWDQQRYASRAEGEKTRARRRKQQWGKNGGIV